MAENRRNPKKYRNRSVRHHAEPLAWDNWIVEDKDRSVRANSYSSQRDQFQPPGFRSPSKTIGAIIRGYKVAVTKKINISRNTPGLPIWQRNYYERVIRDEPELNRIRKYIIENPSKWEYDKYY